MKRSNCLISVAMIMKNEAHNLDRALGSIRPYVDEIIVVDTGSTDESVEIAKKYTDKIYFHEWKDDFSEARNYSLQFPTCKWVLIYDADEEVKEDFAGLRDFLLSLPDDVNTIYLPTISYLDWDLKRIEVASTGRVFRNGTVKYEHMVHNQPVYKGRVIEAKFPIYHYGYIWTRSLKKKKYERSRTLIVKTLETKKLLPQEEIYYTAQLYKIESIGGNVHEKYQLANKTIELMKKYNTVSPIALEVMFLHALDLYAKGLYDLAEQLLKETIELVPENPDPYCGLAILYDAKKNYDEVIKCGEKFFENKLLVEKFPEKFVWTVMSLKFVASVRMVLSIAHLKQDNIEKFKEHFSKIFEELELTAEDPQKVLNYLLANFVMLEDEKLKMVSGELLNTIEFAKRKGIKVPVVQIIDKALHAGINIEPGVFEGFELSVFERFVIEKLSGTQRDFLMDWLFGKDRTQRISDFGIGALITYFEHSVDEFDYKLKILNVLRKSEDKTIAGISNALIGDIYLKLNNIRLALEYYRRALENLPEVSRFLRAVIDDLKSKLTPEIDGVFNDLRDFYFKNREFFTDLPKLYPMEELRHAYLISDSDFAKYISGVYTIDVDKEKALQLLESIQDKHRFPFIYYRLAKAFERSKDQKDLVKAYELHTKACLTNYNVGDIALGAFPFDGFYVSEKCGNENDEIVWVGNISEKHSGLGVISPIRMWKKSRDYYYAYPFPKNEVLKVYKDRLKNYRLPKYSVGKEELLKVLNELNWDNLKSLERDEEIINVVKSACTDLGIDYDDESKNIVSFETLNSKMTLEQELKDIESGVFFYFIPDFANKDDAIWYYPYFRVFRNKKQIDDVLKNAGFKNIRHMILATHLRAVFFEK